MQTLKARNSAPIATGTCAPRAARLACSAQAHMLPPKSRSPVEQASLALAAAAMLPLTALPVLADEAAPAAADVASFTPPPFAFIPLGIYGLFYLYREKVNPKAKISDLFFIVAAAVVFGNIFSILVYKKRIY